MASLQWFQARGYCQGLLYLQICHAGVWLPRGWAGDQLDICMCRCGLVHAELLHSPLLWQLHNAGEERQGEEARPDFRKWLVLDAEIIMRRCSGIISLPVYEHGCTVFLSEIQVYECEKKNVYTNKFNLHVCVKKCSNWVNNFSEATTPRQINASVYYWKSDKMKSIQRCQYAV